MAAVHDPNATRDSSIGRLRMALARYRAFIRDRDPALLLGAGVVSAAGDWFNTVALIALAFNYGDGVLGVGGGVDRPDGPPLTLAGTSRNPRRPASWAAIVGNH